MTLTIEELKYGAEVGDLGIDAVRAVCAEALANREAQPVACDIERIKRHALPAGECPQQSQVVLLSSLQRLLTAPPAPAVPEKCPERVRFLMNMHTDDLFDDADAQEIWNACRAAMLKGEKS